MHWGTFALAMHDWDEPVETLLRLAPKHGAQLLLPQLGAPVEPARGPLLQPWWHAAHVPGKGEPKAVPPEEAVSMPKSVPWPLD